MSDLTGSISSSIACWKLPKNVPSIVNRTNDRPRREGLYGESPTSVVYSETQEDLHFGMTEQPLQDCRDVWIGKRSMKSKVELA